MFFSANDGATGKELWKSDGTLAGTQLVKDINPQSSDSSPFQLTNVNGTLFFTANDGIHGEELWLSDGTATGTQLVKNINLNFPGSTPNGLVNVGGTLYFSANDGTHGDELWKTDGSSQGTQLVKDIHPNEENSDPIELVNVNGTLFFSANHATYGEELWRSDGTATGTQRVRNINPGSEDSWPRGLTNVNGTLFFRANDGTNGNELWMSDGSFAGTQLVRDINPGGADSHPFALTNVNGTLFFAANNGTSGIELWKSDGSFSGTQLVKDLNPSGADASPFSLTNVNGTLFFAAIDGTNGFELWKSDGTSLGTTLVKNVNPSEVGSNPRALTNVNGTLFFSADDGTTGMELWQSDGTAVGTRLARDINPGGANSYPIGLVEVNGSLLFVATDGVRGAELWKAEAGVKRMAIGAEIGSAPRVQVFDANGTPLFDFLAYDAGFTGGVRVAIGDINRDGVDDIITSPGAGGGPEIRIFDGITGAQIQSFFAYDMAFRGGAYVATGDMNADGIVDIITGAGVGGGPDVRVFSGADLTILDQFFAYDITFTGGVRLAVGDVNGDGSPDIVTATGAGSEPQVKVFDRRTQTELLSFFAYDREFSGGVFVAVGDIDGNGIADIVTGAGIGGGPDVRIFRSSDLAIVDQFFAYDIGFSGGVRVALGDINGDGVQDIVTTPRMGGSFVRVFDGPTRDALLSFTASDGGYVATAAVNGHVRSNLWKTDTGTKRLAVGSDAGASPLVQVFDTDGNALFEFLAYDIGFTGGVRVAVGDINRDGIDDIIASPGAGGGPEIRIFDGTNGTQILGFFAYDMGFRGGAYVATGDVNGDGFVDVITGAGPGGSAHVRVFDGNGAGMVSEFLAYVAGFTGGVQVAAGDVDGDGRTDIITGAGPGGTPHVRAVNALLANERDATGLIRDTALLANFAAYDPAFTGGVAVAAGDVNGDGFADIIAGMGVGNAPSVRIFNGTDLTLLDEFLPYEEGFTGGVRVASGDVNGDGFADVLVAPGSGRTSQVRIFDVHASTTLTSFSPLGVDSTRGLFITVGNGPFSRKALFPSDENLSDLDRVLKERILAEIPELLDDSVSDWVKVNKLREWAYSHIDVPAGRGLDVLKLNNDELLNLSAGAIFQLFADNVGGVYCGGSAISLCSLYHLFGFRCYAVGAGFNDIVATHAYCLVEIQHGSQTILVHQDAYLNIGYVDEKGAPLDHYDMLYRIRHRQDTVFAVGNDNVKTPDLVIGASSFEEASRIARSSWAIDPEDPALDNPQFVREGVYTVKTDRFLSRLNERWVVTPTIHKIANRTGYLADASYLYTLPYYVLSADHNTAQEFLHRETQFLSKTDSFPLMKDQPDSSRPYVRIIAVGATTYLDSTDVIYR